MRGVLGNMLLVAAVAVGPLGCHLGAEGASSAQAADDAAPPADEVWLSPAQVAASGLVVAPVARQTIEAPVLCAGKVTFDDERVARIAAPVSGRIAKIHAPLGAHVAAQGPLCSIESLELAQAVAAERGAQADMTTAKRAYERQRTLYEGHAAAQKDLEAAQTAWVQAEAEYLRSRQKSTLLGGVSQISKDSYMLRSPLEGNVVATTAHPGSEVQGQYDAGANVAELFVVGDLDVVWAIADVFEMDTHQVDLGDAVEVDTVAYPNETFRARVDWIADAVDPNTRAVQVRCRLDNPDHRLKPDMFVRMRILADRPRQLALPRRALHRYQGHTVVFVAQQTLAPTGARRFIRRPVAAQEEAFGDILPVLTGLTEGEQVVVQGGVMLLGE